MSVLLLSSASGPESSLNTSTRSNLNASSTGANGQGFTHTLGNVLGQAQASNQSSSQAGQTDKSAFMNELDALISELGLQLEDVMGALGADDLADLQAFLNGQDLSTLSLQDLQAGGTLPEFIAGLQVLLSSELKIEGQTANVLEATLAKLSTLLDSDAAVSAKKQGESAAELLGFSFSFSKTAGTDNGVQEAQPKWLRYDPQQLSKTQDSMSANANANASANASASANANANAMLSKLEAELEGQEEVIKLNTDLLNSKLSAKGNDLSDALSEVLDVTRDKPGTLRFSEIQLRTPSPEAPKPYSTTLGTPVNAEEWAEEVSQKIVWFTGRHIQAAEMHLNPAELGPIDVRINVHNDVTTVTFNVQNSSVRELLEANVVRLREMMDANGVSLGDVNVDSGKQDAQQNDQQNNSLLASGNLLEDELDANAVTEQALEIKSSNLVDYFV